ncbi:MAG TPA: LamG domain-containing protein [Allosphingosinicella sp.]|jgi:hypothetical protein
MRQLMLGDPRSDGSYNALQLDALSSASVSGLASTLLNGSQPFTVDAWVRFNGLPAQATIIGQNGVFAFGSAGNALFLQMGGQTLLSNPSQGGLLDDHWHHICATFDGGMVRFYVNGLFNSGQSFSGTPASGTTPAAVGQGLPGLIRSVRIFPTAFPAERVIQNMLATPQSLAPASALWLDFSQVPAVDVGPQGLPVQLQGNAGMVTVAPALSLGGQGFARPFGDRGINPGGEQIDHYSVQGWIYLNPVPDGVPPPPRQAIFVNSDLDSDTGIALVIQYDATANAYRLVSQRGAGADPSQVLTSTATLPLGQWLNVATTFDGLTLSLYIQGQLDSSAPAVPIPLYRVKSDLLIGAGILAGIPAPGTVLQGYIREIDVWTTALTAAQIGQYMAALPDPTESGLAAAYNFTASPARNQANGHPIGLAEGAVLTGQIGPAATSEHSVETEPPSEDEAALLARWRSEIDFTELLRSNADGFAKAMQSDIEGFEDEADRALIRDRWNEVLETMAGNPTALPFHVTAHESGGTLFIVCHRPTHSFISARLVAGSIPDCLLWRIRLIFTLVAGAIDAFTGIGTRLSDDAISYIGTTILASPAASAKLALGQQMAANTVFAVLATLATEGFLRPLVQMIIVAGFWTLVRVVARMLLVAAGIGAASVIASLVATAATFAALYSQRPDECDPPPQVVLTSITFNHDPTGLAIDALAIRKNMWLEVEVPEWTPAAAAAADCPAAYSNPRVAGRTVTVVASFTISAPSALPVSIQALNGNVLGAIDPITVAFAGNLATVLLQLPHHQLGTAGVRRSPAQWTWQYRIGGGGWVTMAVTNHLIYELLGVPALPWVQSPDRSNMQLPWTDVLDLSCAWANGAATMDQAALKITQAVNNGIPGLIYDVAHGASAYTTPDGAQFLCTEFIERVTGGPGAGAGNAVNCTDCATMVTTFTNSVGGNVFAATMYGSTAAAAMAPFACNQIAAIGTGVWAYPFPPGNQFSYHEVAWTGAGSYRDALYDACLCVDTGPDPWNPQSPHVSGLPAGVTFTPLALPTQLPIATPFPTVTYRERLAQNNDQGITMCVPRGPWPWASGGRRPVQ